MSLRIGVVLGDLNSSGAPWNYISTVSNKLASDSDINVFGLYNKGDHNNISDEVSLVDISSKNPLPTWHRVANKYELDLIHLNGVPKYGHWSSFKVNAPVVATAHGVPHWMQLSGPGRPSKKFNIEYRWRDRVARYTLDAIFAVSDNVRDVYLENAGYKPSKVITTYEGVDDEYFTLPQMSRSDDLPQRYLLHVSGATGKKNVITILHSMRILIERGEQVPPLVIAGRGWKDELTNEVKNMGISEHVHFSGYVNQERLLRYYDNAEMFVFPSLHESFGLPNVEAMARGTPVISSNNSAIPEIVNGGGILLDNPLDGEELADAISRLLLDGELKSELVSKGRSQAKKFTWDSHINRLIGAYKRVLAQN